MVGRLISFEGLDGAGKTTQIDLLERWLIARDIAYLRTREPGGTALGGELRQLLLQRPDLQVTTLAEAFLFQADRAQHFATLILPALAAGTLVVSDRCFDSSIAYQGAAQGLGTELIEQLSLLATQGHAPDLTILLDLDPTQVQVRAAARDATLDPTRVAPDQTGLRSEITSSSGNIHLSKGTQFPKQQSRFDLETVQFHQRLRQAFLTLAHAYPERIKVINAAQPVQAIHQEIVLTGRATPKHTLIAVLALGTGCLHTIQM